MNDREQVIDGLFAQAVGLSPAERKKFFADRKDENSADADVVDEVQRCLPTIGAPMGKNSSTNLLFQIQRRLSTTGRSSKVIASCGSSPKAAWARFIWPTTQN